MTAARKIEPTSRRRAKTISHREMTREQRRNGRIAYPDHPRPRTRAECRNEERPCPYVSCKHHLYLDVTPTGGIKLNFPDLEVWELEETCALDVAERGGLTLDEAGACMNLTRERTRQLEASGLVKLSECTFVRDELGVP